MVVVIISPKENISMQGTRGFVGSRPTLSFLVEADAGFTEIQGDARLETSELILDFETKDSISGLFRKAGDFTLPLNDLVDVRLHRGLLLTRLIFHVNSIESIRGLRWRKGHRFHLGIRRRDRPDALTFVDDINWLMINQPVNSKME
jgi:hypothetical protein